MLLGGHRVNLTSGLSLQRIKLSHHRHDFTITIETWTGEVMAEVTMIDIEMCGVRKLDISAARHDVMPDQPTKRTNAPTINLMSPVVESISLECA
jgi:hypothetical protein